MKQLLFISIAVVLMSILNISQAKMLASGPFYLADGVVPPGQDEKHHGRFGLAIGILPYNVTLDVTCDVVNSSYNKPYPVVIRISSRSGSVSIDGVMSSSNQYLLKLNISKLKARIYRDSSHVGSDDKIIFENFDTSDAVQIKNCIAVYNAA